jgi:hypothetical protein
MSGPPGPGRRAPGFHGAVLLALAALVVARTWPLALHARTHYPARERHARAVNVDQLFTSWILAHDARALVRAPLGVFETNNLHPFRHTLAYSENLLGLAALVLPLHHLAGDPTLDHNAATLLALVLGGWGTFLLVRALGGGAPAAALAALLLTASPGVWQHLYLLHMLAGHWTPIALFALVRLVQTRAWRWSALLAASAALQAWTSLHHGLFLALGLVATTGVLLLAHRPARRALPPLAAAAAAAALACVPLVHPYRVLASETAVDLAGRRGAFACSLDTEAALRAPFEGLRACLAPPLGPAEACTQAAGRLAPWTLLAAGALAALRRRGAGGASPAVLAALAAGGVANLLLALGPRPHPWLPLLYPHLAAVVPAVGALRVPVRAAAYANLIVHVLAGCALGALFRGTRARGRAVIAAGVLAVVLAPLWHRAPLLPAPAPPVELAPVLAGLGAGCGIVELPAAFVDSAPLFRTTAHWQPLLNGYSGASPLPRLPMLHLLRRFPAPESLDFLAEAAVCAAVVPNGEEASIRERARTAGLPARSTLSWTVIELPPPASPPVSAGRAVAVRLPPEAAAAADGDLETVWQSRLSFAHDPAPLTVELAAPAALAALELELGRRLDLYLRTYRVEGSLDGRAWTTLAESPLAVPPLASYRADPRRLRQRIRLPGATVRWLRIGPQRRPPGRGLAPDAGWEEWGVAELRVRAAGGVSPGR